MHLLIKKYLFVIIIVMFGIVVAVFIFKNQTSNEAEMSIESNPIVSPNNKEENPEEPSVEISIKVDVKGEVNRPGVYEVDDEFRVVDVITTAGGLTEEADESKINLAEKVNDEMVIIIPKVGEDNIEPLASTNSGKENDLINVNTASIEELSTLNGIGPKKAQAMIDYREENGPFQEAEDILNVTGIGEKTLQSFKDDIRVK